MKGIQKDELFSRGVATFVDPEGVFQKAVEAKARGEYSKDIIIKLGIDPTRPDIHLGHAVALRKLRAFQDVGCKVIFLIGDYTSMIGDPTGKSKTRPELSQKEIEENMKTYLEQMGKILITDNPKVFSWIRNSDWFLETNDIQVPPGSTVTISDQEGKNNVVVDGNSFVGKAALFHNTRMQMTHLKNNIVHSFPLSRVIGVLRGITHARLIERDMFRERIAKGEELYMHEMLYPVLQGIDSSVIASIYGSCDLEIGGTDQTFNMLMGRDVMRMNKQPEQSVMSLDILEGLDGKEKMSKSLDNYVGISDEPNQMYGKIMSLPDELITRYFALTTYTPLTEVEEIEKGLKSEKLHPKEVKMRLAREIVAIYHGEKMAEEAEKAFTGIFAQGKIPESVLVIEIEKGDTFTITLVKAGCAESKSEARRLIESGAVTMMEEERKITDATEVPVAGTYRVGKHRFFKVK